VAFSDHALSMSLSVTHHEGVGKVTILA
jgi:hypothetical protein